MRLAATDGASWLFHPTSRPVPEWTAEYHLSATPRTSPELGSPSPCPALSGPTPGGVLGLKQRLFLHANKTQSVIPRSGKPAFLFYIRRKAGSAHLGRAVIHGPRTGKQARHAWQVGSACRWISISAQRHDSLTLAAQEAGQGLQAHQAPWLTARICKRVSKGFTPSAAQSLFSSHAPCRRRALRPVRLAQLWPRLRNESCSKEHPPARAKRSTGLHVQRPSAAVVPSRNPMQCSLAKDVHPGCSPAFPSLGMLHKKGVSFDQNDEGLQRDAVDCPAPAQPHQAGQTDQLHGLQGTASLSGQA